MSEQRAMKRVTIAVACREAWESRLVERIAGVADGMRLQHGFNYAQVHACFCESLSKEISLADFDEILRLADEGYTGTLAGLKRGIR